MNRYYHQGQQCCKPSGNCSPCNKCDFGQKKENLICSLNEVEHFLCSFKDVMRYIRLYRIFR